MTAAEREWVPGDPLYTPVESGGSGYRQHLFNFRDDSRNEGSCACPDAASWPEPRSHHGLGATDELEGFIAHWRRWRRIEESA